MSQRRVLFVLSCLRLAATLLRRWRRRLEVLTAEFVLFGACLRRQSTQGHYPSPQSVLPSLSAAWAEWSKKFADVSHAKSASAPPCVARFWQPSLSRYASARAPEPGDRPQLTSSACAYARGGRKERKSTVRARKPKSAHHVDSETQVSLPTGHLRTCLAPSRVTPLP